MILAEFALGTIGGGALGVWALTWRGVTGIVLGIWLLGVGVNYLPLLSYVVALWPPGALKAELAGIDLEAEIRHYTRVQFRVLVPFWVAVLALLQRDGR